MNVPDRTAAHELLNKSGAMNPGKWTDHSQYVAQAAEIIASRIPELDADTAYVMGLLHDVGRYVGYCHIKHVVKGYQWMNELGYTDIARICYTHSFALQNAGSYTGSVDCTPEEYADLTDYIVHAKYDDYDRLIQLCDALAGAEGYCLIEKRLVDVSLRYGANPYIIDKWKAIFSNKDYFDQKSGCNIYRLLPGIEDITFGY